MSEKCEHYRISPDAQASSIFNACRACDCAEFGWAQTEIKSSCIVSAFLRKTLNIERAALSAVTMY